MEELNGRSEVRLIDDLTDACEKVARLQMAVRAVERAADKLEERRERRAMAQMICPELEALLEIVIALKKPV